MSRPGFSFCICPDSTILKERISTELRAQPGEWERRVFWADEELTGSFWESMTLPGLMGGNRAVVLRRSELLKTDDWAKFMPVLSRFSSRIWLFLCLEGEWKGKNPPIPAVLSKQKFFEVARKKGWVWSSPGLSPRDVPARIAAWAERHGLSFEPKIQSELCRILPPDASGMNNELHKLLLSLGDRTRIEQSDLAVISYQPDMDIFLFLDGLVRSNAPERVWDKVLRSQIGSDSTMIFPFLALLLREARILWQLHTGESENIRLPHQVKSVKQDLARRLGLSALSRIWELALDAESGVKTGRHSPEQALELLVSGTMVLIRESRPHA